MVRGLLGLPRCRCVLLLQLALLEPLVQAVLPRQLGICLLYTSAIAASPEELRGLLDALRAAKEMCIRDRYSIMTTRPEDLAEQG